MMIWISRLLTCVVLGVVALLTLSALPSLSGDELSGKVLIAHMSLSGVLVVFLPIFAIVILSTKKLSREKRLIRGIGFWGLVGTGLLTIATVFLCMLPVASTEEMHKLILWHGRFGYAMALLGILFLLASLSAQQRQTLSDPR